MRARPPSAARAIYPDLAGRTVLVTGGATGIGAAIVRTFSDQGAKVFFCDLKEQPGKKLAARTGAKFSRVDLRREPEIRHWINSVSRKQKRIDCLVNNAAADPRIPFASIAAAQWDRLFALNLRAYFIAARHVIPHMPPDSSTIINLGSITIHTAPAQMVAYVSTKAAILGFSRALARELGPRRIRVNTLSPGWVMTDRQLRDYVTPAVKKLIKGSQCIPRLIFPEEMASIVLFLASSMSSAITGQEILADRGWAHL